MAMDIDYFGVPMEFDTGSNERGHKVVKKAAKLMQRCKETFDRQTAVSMEQLTVLQYTIRYPLLLHLGLPKLTQNMLLASYY